MNNVGYITKCTALKVSATNRSPGRPSSVRTDLSVAVRFGTTRLRVCYYTLHFGDVNGIFCVTDGNLDADDDVFDDEDRMPSMSPTGKTGGTSPEGAGQGRAW